MDNENDENNENNEKSNVKVVEVDKATLQKFSDELLSLMIKNGFDKKFNVLVGVIGCHVVSLGMAKSIGIRQDQYDEIIKTLSPMLPQLTVRLEEKDENDEKNEREITITGKVPNNYLN